MRRFLFALAIVCLTMTASARSPRPPSERLTAWLFATAREMPSGRVDETLSDYLTRLETMARALALEAPEFATGRAWTSRELTLAALVVWHAESGFDVRIHAGSGHPVLHEDHGRARCLGQVHLSRLVPEGEWLELPGTSLEETRRCARATLLVLSRQAGHCAVWAGQRATEDGVARTLAAYGSGGSCVPTKDSRARASRWAARIAQTPEYSPLKGYRLALPSEVTPELWARAATRGEPWQVVKEDRWAILWTRRQEPQLFVVD